MPKILEIKDMDGELWVRVGKPGEFESGIALWTPEEQQANFKSGYNMALYDLRSKQND